MESSLGASPDGQSQRLSFNVLQFLGQEFQRLVQVDSDHVQTETICHLQGLRDGIAQNPDFLFPRLKLEIDHFPLQCAAGGMTGA